MYSLPSYQTQGFWQASANLPNSHSHWLSSERTLSSGCASQVRRPLTPPRDMSSSATSYRSYGSKFQEPGHYHTERDPVNHAYSTQYDSATESLGVNQARSRSHISQGPPSKQTSPTLSQQSFSSSQTHKGSQGGIAPALQIPRAINNSRGSLADLAAQITCLFWFETSTVLEFADTSDGAVPFNRVLNKDANPTTGFRKWVTTILSTTQVAQNVILLALLFIYRLKRQNPSVMGKPGSEYRLLTVALMLGNKFLDDNTYTNKTWAEVSGISVMEVHIMEVEFLSNMKYNLFTSAEQWSDWQKQLGKFARFFETATQSPPPQLAALSYKGQYGTANLPSPPTSFQASPPRAFTPSVTGPSYPSPATHVPQPVSSRPSPLKATASFTSASRKRSFDDDDDELQSAAKRVMYNQPHYQQRTPQNVPVSGMSPYEMAQQQRQSSSTTLYHPFGTQHQSGPQAQRESHVHAQLPPLSQKLQGPGPALPTPWQNTPTTLAPHPSSLAMALQSARTSRNHSPYPSSNNVSPTNTALLPTNCVTPQNGQSPSIYLAQRDSPYKPVRGVHTLLVPPPSRAMHQHEQVCNSQMHYQPLGRPFTERQQGRLPYVAQNQWFDGTQQKMAMEQWSNTFINSRPGYHRH